MGERCERPQSLALIGRCAPRNIACILIRLGYYVGMEEQAMNQNGINIAPHGDCNIVSEHGQEWAVCNVCGAQWALEGADLEQVTQGDGYCEGKE